MHETGRLPDEPIDKTRQCRLCHRIQACVGYFCDNCGRRATFGELYQFQRHGTCTSVIGTKRCSCGERRWLFPCEVPAQQRNKVQR